MAGYVIGGSGQIPGIGGGTELNWVMLTASDVAGNEDPFSILNGTITQSGDFIQIPVSDSAVHTTLNTGLNIEFGLPAEAVLDGSKSQALFTEVSWETLPGAQWIAALGVRDAGGTPSGLVAGVSRAGANAAAVVVRAVGIVQSTALSPTSLVSLGSVGLSGNWDGVDIVDNQAWSQVEEGGVVRGACLGMVGGTGLRSRTNLILSIGHNAGILHTETLGVKARYAIVDLTG